MAPKRSLVPQKGYMRLLAGVRRPLGPSICPFCSLTPAARDPRARPKLTAPSRRWQSTSATPAPPTTNPRVELEHVLLELQNKIPSLVNLSRVQLALQGLQQAPGQEAVRIAVLGLAGGSDGRGTARKVLKALLIDPLIDEQKWEKELEQQDPDQPLIIRVGQSQAKVTRIELSNENLPQTMDVSSAELNGLNLELLSMDIELPSGSISPVTVQGLEEAVLAPTVQISTRDTDTTPLTTPVHQTLLVADGLMGAVGVSSLPVLNTGDVLAAVDLKGLSKEKLGGNFVVIDTSLGEESVQLFRQGPEHAMEYEHRWTDSNLGALTAWLKAGLKASDNQATKPAVRKLIVSVLQSAFAAIEREFTSTKLSRNLSAGSSTPELRTLNESLSEWAQKAHTELQEELDLAFTGHRWRKLGWWKLFWRVDDVAMLTTEIMSRRFLPSAEQELVYLTGRIAQLQGETRQYPQPASLRESMSALKAETSKESKLATYASPQPHLPKWPGHIAFTRRYILQETVPALQSLAQQLVIQSLGTTSIATSLAALLYVSSSVSTVFEAGAVAALGLVYSLARMQKKWETAREFWEGDVREEGRKAVRAAEESAAIVLDGGQPITLSSKRAQHLEEARELVAKAEDALARMK